MSSTQTTASGLLDKSESLIRYVEVWIPNHDGNLLELAGAEVVEAETRAKKIPTQNVAALALGEGIAGAAWKQKSATILQEDPSDLLQKISSEAGTPLAAVVAIPVFRQQEIRGVIVLGFSDAYGAAEIWSRDNRDELAVTGGHYSGLPSFEFITRYTRFPKGAGLPGAVWKTGEPKLAQDLETSSSFIRSFGNDPAIISSAIGIPIASIHGFPSSVLLLLGAAKTPLARRTDIWTCLTQTTDADPESTTTVIRTSTGIGSTETKLPEEWQAAVMKMISGSQAPVLTCADSQSLPADAKFSVAIPIFRAMELTAVVSFVF